MINFIYVKLYEQQFSDSTQQPFLQQVSLQSPVLQPSLQQPFAQQEYLQQVSSILVLLVTKISSVIS